MRRIRKGEEVANHGDWGRCFESGRVEEQHMPALLRAGEVH